MIELSITIVGEQAFKQAIDDLALNQVPFALAKSLTKTAQNRQDAVRAAMGDGRFILRQAARLKGGVRIEPATKQNLIATVKDIDTFMVLQEVGGEKRPKFGKYICVPLPGARPTPQAKIAKQDLPGAVMASGLGFIHQSSTGTLIMFRRIQKQRTKRKRGVLPSTHDWSQTQVQAMYALVPEANMSEAPNPRFHFKETVMLGIADIFREEFARNFEEAKRTAKL